VMYHTSNNGSTYHTATVSREAYEERGKNWVEIYGCAAGSATLHHRDWYIVLAMAGLTAGHGENFWIFEPSRPEPHLIWLANYGYDGKPLAVSEG
jgi:hypothetical protein